MRPIKKGATDQDTTIRIVDSGDGTPETGVVFNTSGIDMWYRRQGAVKTSITEATLSALNDAHSDGGILHIGDGYYRLDLPDAAVATGANHVTIGGTVTGMVVIGSSHPLVDYDPQDTVRLGLTALPNAAADAAGGLPISDAGGLDLDAKIGALTFTVANKVDANTTHLAGTSQTGRDIGASVLLSSGTGTGQVSLSSGRVNADVVYWNAAAVASPATAGYPVVTHKVGTGTGEIDISSGRVNSDVVYWNAAAVASPDTAGYPKVTVKSGTGTGEVSISSGRVNSDVVYWSGAAVASPASAGHPVVTHKVGTGTGEIAISSGRVNADVVYWAAAAVAAVNTSGVPKVDNVLWLGVAPLALTSQLVQAHVAAMGTDTLTATALAASAVTEIVTGVSGSITRKDIEVEVKHIQNSGS